MVGAGGLLARDDNFLPTPEISVPLLCGKGRLGFLRPLLLHSYLFFTVLNSEQSKVEWDYLPSAINATLSLGSRGTANVETASCSGLCAEQVREKGWVGMGGAS